MMPEVHIYIDRSEAETWNHDEIDNLQGKINTGEYSMSKVIIIGGGAAGMMAGVFAARNHHEVHILEKNEKLGKKVFITGKGRCNVTNACDTEELFPAMMSNPKFLYSSFYSFTPQDVMEFFEKAGVPLKVERGNRVFPQSDHSSDIIRALERELKKAGAKIHLHTAVQEIVKKPVTDSANTLESEATLTESGSDAGKSRKGKKSSDIQQEKITGVILTDGTFMEGDAVIVATGGFSYQSTGSTGDGYRFARELGLKVTDIAPSLVPLKTKEDYIPKLQGLSLKNTGLTIKNGKKVLYVCKANGAAECKKALLLLKAARLPEDFIEGMACEGGCVGGPSAFNDQVSSKKNRDTLIGQADDRTIHDNLKNYDMESFSMHRE